MLGGTPAVNHKPFSADIRRRVRCQKCNCLRNILC